MSAFNLGLSQVVETAALTIKLEDGAFSYFDLDSDFNPGLAALRLEEGAEDFEQLEDFLAQAEAGDQEIFLGCVEFDDYESDGSQDDEDGAEESKDDTEDQLKQKWPVLLVLTYQEVEKSSEVDSEKLAKTALVNISIVSLEPGFDQKLKLPIFKTLLNQKLQEVLTKTQNVLISRHEVASPRFKHAPPVFSVLWKSVDLKTSVVKASVKKTPSLFGNLSFNFIGSAMAEREPEPFELMPSLTLRDPSDESLVGQSDLLTILSGATFLAASFALFYEAFQDAEKQGGPSSDIVSPPAESTDRVGADLCVRPGKKGLVINLAQAHPHLNGFEYYKDQPDALREVLVSQLQVAEEIMKLIQEALKKSGTAGLDVHVFLEGLFETLTPDYPGYLQDQKTASLLFPEGLPQSADVDSLTEAQQKFLVTYRSSGVLFLLGYLSQLHPTIPKELAESILQRIQAGEINDELIDLIVEGRSRMALWMIQEFFGDEFVNAILVFGAGHDLSKYCEDLDYELRRIDCALPAEMDVTAPLSREALKAYQKKEGAPTRTIHFDYFPKLLNLLGLNRSPGPLEISEEPLDASQRRHKIRYLRKISKLVHFFSNDYGVLITRTAAEIEAHFPSDISIDRLLSEGVRLFGEDIYQLDFALLDLVADKADQWNQYERQCRQEEQLQKKVKSGLHNEQNNSRSNSDLLSFFTDQMGNFIARSSAEIRANYLGNDPVLLLLRENKIECSSAGFYKIHPEMLARLSPEELAFNTLRKEIFAHYELFENLRNFFKREGFHGKELGLEQFKAEFQDAPIQAVLMPHLIIDEASRVCEIRAESLSVHDSMKADFRRRNAEVFEEPAPTPISPELEQKLKEIFAEHSGTMTASQLLKAFPEMEDLQKIYEWVSQKVLVQTPAGFKLFKMPAVKKSLTSDFVSPLVGETDPTSEAPSDQRGGKPPRNIHLDIIPEGLFSRAQIDAQKKLILKTPELFQTLRDLLSQPKYLTQGMSEKELLAVFGSHEGLDVLNPHLSMNADGRYVLRESALQAHDEIQAEEVKKLKEFRRDQAERFYRNPEVLSFFTDQNGNFVPRHVSKIKAHFPGANSVASLVNINRMTKISADYYEAHPQFIARLTPQELEFNRLRKEIFKHYQAFETLRKFFHGVGLKSKENAWRQLASYFPNPVIQEVLLEHLEINELGLCEIHPKSLSVHDSLRLDFQARAAREALKKSETTTPKLLSPADEKTLQELFDRYGSTVNAQQLMSAFPSMSDMGDVFKWVDLGLLHKVPGGFQLADHFKQAALSLSAAERADTQVRPYTEDTNGEPKTSWKKLVKNLSIALTLLSAEPASAGGMDASEFPRLTEEEIQAAQEQDLQTKAVEPPEKLESAEPSLLEKIGTAIDAAFFGTSGALGGELAPGYPLRVKVKHQVPPYTSKEAGAFPPTTGRRTGMPLQRAAQMDLGVGENLVFARDGRRPPAPVGHEATPSVMRPSSPTLKDKRPKGANLDRAPGELPPYPLPRIPEGEPLSAPANGVTKMLSSEDVAGRKDPALLISDPANANQMDAKEILDFADHVLSECLLNEYRGEQPYKELIQKERLQFDAAREAVRLNPGQSGALLHLQESAQKLEQMIEMHREIAAFQGGTLEHYADEMKVQMAPTEGPYPKVIKIPTVPKVAMTSALPAVPNLPARLPEKSMSVLASEVPKGEGLDLHRHQDLLEKQRNLYRACVQELTEAQSKSHFDLPKAQQAEFLERLRESQKFIKDYRANPRNIHEYTLKKLFPQAAPSKLAGHGWTAPFVGEGFGYLVGQGVKALGGSESLQHGLHATAAVVGTGVAALVTGAGIPGAVVQAGVVGFVHGAGYAERGEASIFGSVSQDDPNRRMANAGIGAANLVSDYFSAPFVAGIAVGEAVQAAEVSHLAAEIYGPPRSLDEHLKQRSERPDPVPTLTAAVKKVGEHLSKIGEQVLQVEGLEEIYSPSLPTPAAPSVSPTGGETKSRAEKTAPKTKETKGPISRFLDGVGEDLRSFAPAPVQQPAPSLPPAPPQPLVIRPTFSPVENFTGHLWAQQQQQSRFVSPIDTWRQQNQFRFEASKSSVSYLSPANIYGSLSQSSSYSSQPSWFQAPGASFGPSAGSLLSRNSRRPFDQELRNLAKAAYENQGFYRGSFGDAHATFSSQCRSHGWGSGDFRDFVNLLRSTGLVASYEASHAAPWSNIPRLGGLRGDIGGVATKVGVIEGLKDLLDRGEITDFNFAVCVKPGHLSFTPEENTQIQYEVAYAALVQETFVFFSLHFNKQSNMYPVHHPAFNNLAGRVAAFADVMMKGFLNGGVYSEAFLDAWPQTQNSDPDYLKANLIDLKKYCREHGLDFTYKSLRELSMEMGLEELGERASGSDTSPYGGMKYMTSFRIIAKQEESFLFDPKTRTFLIKPYFDVKYTIDLMPDYKAYLEKYKAEHGEYPEDYEKVKKLYARMAERIKTQMPQIPLFKKYFELLGLISFYSYLFNTLKKSGFVPKLPSLPDSARQKVGIPEVFPHIPVRAYQKIPVEINLAEVFSGLSPLELGYLNNFFIKRFEDPSHKLEINLGSNKALCQALEKIIAQILLNKVGESLKSEDPEIFEAHQKSATQDFKELLEAVCEKRRESMMSAFEKMRSKWGLASLASDFSKRPKVSDLFNQLEAGVRAKFLEETQEFPQSTRETRGPLAESIREINRLAQERIAKELKQIDAEAKAQLATIPAHLLDINQENIRAFKAQIEADKAAVRAEILANGEKIIAALRLDFKGERSRIRDERLALLAQMRLELPTPIQSLERAALEGSKIKFSYIVSTLSIGDQAYFDACPSHAKVVGGCSVSLPAHDLKLVNFGEDFLRSAEYQGQSYEMFSLSILSEMALSPMDYLKLFPGAAPQEKVLKKPLLISAAEAGDSEANLKYIDGLISAGEDINACLPNGLFALYIAIQESHVQTALDLIQKGAGRINLNQVLDTGMSAVHLAVMLELQEVAEALIQAGANLTLKRKSDGATAFHLAAERGLTDVCQAMLSRSDNSIDVDQALESGKTALHLAVQAGYLETVKLLVDDWGANVDLETLDLETPILIALKQGHLEMAEFLAAEISMRGDHESKADSALLLAAQLRLWSVVDILIARGISPLKLGENGRSCIYYLLAHGELQRYQAVAKKLGLSPHLEFNGSSSLAIALAHGHLALVYQLGRVGADLCVRPDREGSQRFKTLRIKADDLAWLRKYIAESKPKWSETEFTKQMKTTLSWAAVHGSKACMREVLKTLKPNELAYLPGEGGGRHSILHPFLAAVMNGRKSVIDLMVQHSPNVLSARLQEAGEVTYYPTTTKSMKYNKAIHIAAQYGHHHLFKYFQEQGVNLYEHQENSPNWGYDNNAYRILLKNNDKAGLEALFKITSIQEWIEHGWYEILRDILEADRVGRSAGYQVLKAMPVEKLRQQILLANQTWCSRGDLALSEGLKSAYQSGNQEQVEWLITLGAIEKPETRLPSLNAPTELGIALETAFKTDDREAISSLKIKPYLWLEKDDQGLTIFQHMARSQNKIKVTAWFNLLIERISPRGGVLDAYNFISKLGGPSALDLASALQHEWFLKLAYEYSDVKNQNFSDGSSWLHVAAISGSVDLVKFFLSAGVPLSKDFQQKTPLILAAEIGNLPLVKLLISSGDSPNHQDIFGNTALHYALINKHQALALELYTHMSETALRVKNRLGHSPLMLAAASDCLPLVRLLNPGDESHRVDKEGNTAMHLAAASGSTTVMPELVSNGFEVDAVRRKFLFTPLHIAAIAGKYEAFVLLLDFGVDPLKKDAFGVSPLERAVMASSVPQLGQLVCGLSLAATLKIQIKIWFAAAMGNNLDVLRELLLLNFPVDTRDKKQSRSALHLAVINQADQAVNLLLGAGIDREGIDSRGNTAMHFAVKHQALLSFRLLCELGVEIDRQNKRGNTPLHKAVKTGSVFLAKKLLSLGANSETQNSQMMTPKRLAKKKGGEMSWVFEHAGV